MLNETTTSATKAQRWRFQKFVFGVGKGGSETGGVMIAVGGGVSVFSGFLTKKSRQSS